MKFLCENCKAKYQIADEKVAGRSVRMKCRKCQHLIEIRSSVTETSATLVFSANLLRGGASDAPPSVAAPALHGVSESPTRASAAAPPVVQPIASARSSAPRPGARETKQSANGDAMVPTGTVVHGGLASAFQQAVAAEAKAASEPAPSTGNEWFVGVNGSPIGPIGVDELRTRASAGEVQEDSLVWREGFSEWVPLGTVPELRDIARLVRVERSPLSSRAGALISRLNIGPRSVRPPVSGGQVVPLGPRSEAGRGSVPAGQVHETLALSPGALPLVLPGLAARSGAPGSTPAAAPAPSAPAPAPVASPAPVAPAPAPMPAAPMPAAAGPFGAPMGSPGMGALGGMGSPMGSPMGAPMGSPMGPGMGSPGFGGMAPAPMQMPAPIQHQVMQSPFQQQPFGMAPAAPPGFGLPPPPGFPTNVTPGFGPVVSATTPRRKGGIPLAGWFAVAAALGTGVAVGAMVFRSGSEDNTEMKAEVKSDSDSGSDTAANTESAGSGSAEATGAGGGAAEEAGGAGGAGEGAAGAGSESAGAGGAGENAAGSGSTENAAGSGSTENAAGSGPSETENAAGSGAVAAATPPAPTTASRTGGGVRHSKPKPASEKPAAPVAAVPTVNSLTNPPSGPSVGGPTARPGGGGGGGQLTSEQVQGVVNNGRAAIRRACWEPALAAKGGGATSTRVSVSIAIGPDGKVQGATASGGDNFPSLGGCIAGRVRSWIFPSSSGTTNTTATFNFAAQ